jgi:hypothetical protein
VGLGKINCEDERWMDPVQNCIQCRYLVFAVLIIQVLLKYICVDEVARWEIKHKIK